MVRARLQLVGINIEKPSLLGYRSFSSMDANIEKSASLMMDPMKEIIKGNTKIK